MKGKQFFKEYAVRKATYFAKIHQLHLGDLILPRHDILDRSKRWRGKNAKTSEKIIEHKKKVPGKSLKKIRKSGITQEEIKTVHIIRSSEDTLRPILLKLKNSANESQNQRML